MMDEIIKYDNEHTGLDFKAIQYTKDKYPNLLKDIIAMANADYKDNRFIIVGIKHLPSGEKETISIEEKDFVDSATYQQLINENIEPDINLTYEPYLYNDNITLGIFCLSNCDQQPYMLKKDYSKLKKGDCFVRKGSHQMKATRADFERIYQKRNPFINKINIFFKDTKLESIKVSSIDAKNIILESDRQIKKVKDIIKEKELNTIEKDPSDKLNFIRLNIPYMPLKNRSIQELNKRLETAKDTYRDDDLYEYQEKYAYRLNFDILNSSIEYIEDVSIEITIDKSDNYFIFDKPLEKPSSDSFPTPNHSYILECMDYPNVDNTSKHFIIKNHIGDIKHQIEGKAFKSDLFIFLKNIGVSYDIPIHIKLFGKNLTYPIVKKLIIYVN